MPKKAKKKKRPKTTHWNYRATVERMHGGKEKLYTVRELYYEDDKVVSWTEESVMPLGESKTEFLLDIDHYYDVVNHPIWDIDKRKWVEWPKSLT